MTRADESSAVQPGTTENTDVLTPEQTAAGDATLTAGVDRPATDGPDAAALDDAAEAARPGTVSRIAGWALFGVLTVLFGYAVWAAVGNLTGIPKAAEMMGLGVSPAGWLWLGIGVAVPVIGYAVALMLGVGRGLWTRALILTAALATVAVIQLDLMNLVGTSTYFE